MTDLKSVQHVVVVVQRPFGAKLLDRGESLGYQALMARSGIAVHVAGFHCFVDGRHELLRCVRCSRFVAGIEGLAHGVDLVFNSARNAPIDERPGFCLTGAFCC